MMGHLNFVWLAAILSLFPITLAQVVQDDWIFPSLPDEGTTLTLGEEYNLTWTRNLQAWFAQYAASANVTNVDLWITGSYQAQFAHLVSAKVDVARSTYTQWRVQLPDDEFAQTNKWTFRFLPAGVTWSGPGREQISSPRILVQDASQAATASTSSSRLSSTATTSTSLSTSSSSAEPSQQPTSSSTNSGLSSGAIAGIAVAVALGTALLVGLAWFLSARRRSSKAQARRVAPHMTNPDEHSAQNTSLYTDRENVHSHSSRNTDTYYSELPSGYQPAQLPSGT